MLFAAALSLSWILLYLSTPLGFCIQKLIAPRGAAESEDPPEPADSVVGHPYRDPQVPAASAPSREPSVVEQYAHLFALPEDDALWAEWREFYRTEALSTMAFDVAAREGLRARALRDMLAGDNPDIWLNVSEAVKLPQGLRGFVFDFALELAAQRKGSYFGAILRGIAASGERQARRAVDLLDAGEKRGRFYLTSLIEDRDVELALRVRADERVRAIVEHDEEVAREYFSSLGCNCWRSLHREECDLTLLRGQVEFLARIGSAAFCSYATVPMLRRHFNGAQDAALRLRILRLYVGPIAESVRFVEDEIDSEWIAEAAAAGDLELVGIFRDGLARCEAAKRESEAWKRDHDAKVAALAERVRAGSEELS